VQSSDLEILVDGVLPELWNWWRPRPAGRRAGGSVALMNAEVDVDDALDLALIVLVIPVSLVPCSVQSAIRSWR
jgi:hypothetical protein